jgi:hypothetical protein
MLGSMGAGALFSPWGMLSELESVRSGEWETVVLTLNKLAQFTEGGLE